MSAAAGFDLAVDALAAYRLARLMTTDKITEPARDAIEARSVEVVVKSEPWSMRASTVKDVQPWAFVRDMLDCSWCSGVWAGFAVQALPRWVRRALAGAAVAGLIAEWRD